MTPLAISMQLLALGALGLASLLLLGWALRRQGGGGSAAAGGAACFVVFALVLKPLFQQAIGLDAGWRWWTFALTAALYQAGRLPLWLVETLYGAAGLSILPWVRRTLVPAWLAPRASSTYLSR